MLCDLTLGSYFQSGSNCLSMAEIPIYEWGVGTLLLVSRVAAGFSLVLYSVPSSKGDAGIEVLANCVGILFGRNTMF